MNPKSRVCFAGMVAQGAQKRRLESRTSRSLFIDGNTTNERIKTAVIGVKHSEVGTKVFEAKAMVPAVRDTGAARAGGPAALAIVFRQRRPHS
jgi:hypothetical protein